MHRHKYAWLDSGEVLRTLYQIEGVHVIKERVAYYNAHVGMQLTLCTCMYMGLYAFLPLDLLYGSNSGYIVYGPYCLVHKGTKPILPQFISHGHTCTFYT